MDTINYKLFFAIIFAIGSLMAFGTVLVYATPQTLDPATAETISGNWVITGDLDIGGGGIEIENNTAVPGSCTVGQLFLDTDATAGQQLYACEGGSFVLQGDGAGNIVDDTTPQLGGDLDLNTYTLLLDDSPNSNLGFEGMKIQGKAAENLSWGDVVYINSSGQYAKADASASSTMEAVGISVATTTSGNTGDILQYGYVRNDNWSFTARSRVYVSATPGGPTETAPATSGDIVQKIGYATGSSTVIFVDFDSTIVEVQ